jgi:glycosyltransferase involved in cell wall biosynthesis
LSKPLRILRYHQRAAVGDGGMTGAIRRWADAVTQAGAIVTIAYDLGEPPVDRGPAKWSRVRHRAIGPFNLPRDMRSELRDADLLVLHSGWTAHNLRAASIARSLGVPYMLEPRGAYNPAIVRRNAVMKRVWWQIGERRLVEDAAAIHVFFDEERSDLAAIGYTGNVVVVPNGVHTPSHVVWSGSSSGYLLWLGRFDPEHKGLDLLIDAVASMEAALRPTIRLHGPDWAGGKRRTSDHIARRGMDQWLVTGPPVYGPEKQKLLTEASGFLYPSRWDACPNSVLEAVSIGIPTLCTPYPLGSYLARRGGAVLAEATVDGLAKGLLEFSDRDHMKAIGATGVEIARSEFRWVTVAERWLDQVQASLGTSRPRDERFTSTTGVTA